MCPPYGVTHSILPDTLLPICRCFIDDVLKIGLRLAQKESIYAIAKKVHESVSTIRNLRAWIFQAATVIFELTSAAGLLNELPPRPSPKTSIASFSRAFYPKRFRVFPAHTILTG